MSSNGPNPRLLGWYYAMAQVGFEMVAPIALGWWLDSLLDSGPWILVAGVILGMAGGFLHLVILANHEPPEDDKP
jgi:F0F1-type ATP synthase assembly protein I